MNFEELRIKYPNFSYNSYKIEEDEEKIRIEYEFEIEGLIKFNPSIEILKKKFNFKDINTNIVKNMVFNIGLIESISYFKATCSPHFLIKCGKVDAFQISWLKKLMYLGLGEFRYRNNIDVTEEALVDITSTGISLDVEKEEDNLKGILIPVGGGKDSNVTMDLLKDYKDDSVVFRIGKNDVSDECAKQAGFDEDKIVEVKRVIDKNLLDLNTKGFLNGHTPFSAIVAFISYLCAYLLGKKYITLSNEDSANESNVQGEKINHQYSKTIEFENDFREYQEKYLLGNVDYFSLLRPISELQIAMLFSKLEKYHKVFKSCNVGSKQKPWVWCCNCPKCLFVYSILSPFLYKEKLVDIFGQDMFENKELLNTFMELCGYRETKPFECVGTYNEVRYAISRTIFDLSEKNQKLPYLLEYYKDNCKLIISSNILTFYNPKNNLPKEFDDILKNRIFDNI